MGFLLYCIGFKSFQIPCTPPSPRVQKGLQGSASIPCVKVKQSHIVYCEIVKKKTSCPYVVCILFFRHLNSVTYVYDNPLRVSFTQASSNHPPDTSPASRNLLSKPESGSNSNSELVFSIPMAGFKLSSPIGVVQQKLPTGWLFLSSFCNIFYYLRWIEHFFCQEFSFQQFPSRRIKTSAKTKHFVIHFHNTPLCYVVNTKMRIWRWCITKPPSGSCMCH